MYKRVLLWHERQPLSKDQLELLLGDYRPMREISPYRNPEQSKFVQVGSKVALLLSNGLVDYRTITQLSDARGFDISGRDELGLQHKGEEFCIDSVNDKICEEGYKVLEKFPWEDLHPSEEALELALYASWCRETSNDPKRWNEKKPYLGQCAVTALVVQDYHGGEIVWSEAILPTWKGGKPEYRFGEIPKDKMVSHYFNFICGAEVDYTREQFPRKTLIPIGQPRTQGFPSTRDYLLSNEETLRRYLLLKERVERCH